MWLFSNKNEVNHSLIISSKSILVKNKKIKYTFNFEIEIVFYFKFWYNFFNLTTCFK